MAVAPKQWVIRIIISVVLYLLLGILSILANSRNIKSFKRGFFCDDQSLWHPYYEDTVSENLVIALSVVLPLVFVCLGELWCFFVYTRSSSGSKSSDENSKLERGEVYVLNNRKIVHPSIVNMLVFCGIYYYGLVLNQTITDIGKFSIGRLRPHFFKVCNPVGPNNEVICSASSSNSRSTNFVTNYKCSGGKNITNYMLYNVHLSFPSGHSSAATYCAVFIVIYLQYRLRGCSRLPVLRIFLQSILLAAAFYCGMSRISDYKHHWSDVLGGFVVGIVCAVVASLQNERLRPNSNLLHIQLPKPSEDSINSENHRNSLPRTTNL